ncbi:DUF7882 family protein [Leucobacter sp. VD1]|uniref:DUF7882 family protein n=1 Tax=Leucobacter sp. VD1 TaxID=3080381 RepID=UPI0030171DD0
MGHLIYGGTRYEFEDRQLAHLQLALERSLSRHGSFRMSWFPAADEDTQKTSLWMTPDVALDFEYGDSTPPQINEAWVAIMERASHTPLGLVLISESDTAEVIERLIQEISSQAPRDGLWASVRET